MGTPETNSIHVGYMPGWQQEETVLILGGGEGLAALAADLRQLVGTPGGTLSVTRLPYVRARGGARLMVCACEPRRARGLVSTPGAPAGSFDWLLEDEMILEIAEKLESLAGAPGPGHQDLSVTAVEDARVVASKGEYETDLLDSDASTS